MRFIILIYFTITLIFPLSCFAALDYGKQSLLGVDFSGSDAGASLEADDVDSIEEGNALIPVPQITAMRGISSLREPGY